MPRYRLMAAMEKADLSQAALARRTGLDHRTISRCVRGIGSPQSDQKEAIRRVLKNDDSDLFLVTSEPCNIPIVSDTMNSSDLQPPVTLGSVEGFSFMDKLRRLIISSFGISLVGNVQMITGPVVDPEEYLAQCNVTIDDCWAWLGQGEFSRVERALNTHMPTLTHFANTISPFQGIAAGLAVEAKLMQGYLSSHKLDYTARELHCTEAVHFAVLSGNMRLYTIALEWQGYTYTISDSLQPQRAIALFEQGFSSLKSDAPLSKANIFIGLALAHAQDKDETDDTEVRKYIELARITLPAHPALDPFYRHCGLGQSELDQQEGQTYLCLAERSSNSGYAQMAYDMFDESVSKLAMNQSKRAQSLIRKANAARLLGEKDECVTCLTDGFHIGVEINSLRRSNEAQDVMNRIPNKWRQEPAIQSLQKDISQALVVARR